MGQNVTLRKVENFTFLVVLKLKGYSLKEWNCLCNLKDILRLETAIEGIKVNNKNNFSCDARAREKCDNITKGNLVSCDLSGPIRPNLINESKYAITFPDDYSGLITVNFLKDKTQTVAFPERFLSDMAPYGSIKRMRTADGTELTCSKFKRLLIRNQIKQVFSELDY